MAEGGQQWEKGEIFLPDVPSERTGDCSKGCSSFMEGHAPQWCGAVCEEGAVKPPALGARPALLGHRVLGPLSL